ncbi:piezo-type mechanosensitive ion channel component 1 isoform X3 [Marmota flaviventris]|uniref:piezo-type mechanosensitive ion channel component 1 isoform X3 n=1 Tax=Marmota flaviventris TaxID=93162 RepID=UPI003A86966F
MEPHVLGAVLYWLLLPCTLLAAALLRISALSLVYLLVLLLLPWLPGPSRHSVPGHPGRLLRALLSLSLLFLVAHLVFQICLHTMPHLDQLLGSNCSFWETVSQHIGVTRLDLKDIPNTTRMVAPDLGVLVVSSICLGLGRRLTRRAQQSQCAQESDDEGDMDVDTGPPAWPQGAPALAPGHRSRLAARLRVTAHWLLVAAGRTLAIVLLALAGIAHPSAFSSVYLLVFLAICTWWACHLPLSPLGFSTLCVMVSCFGAGHLICLYCYQTPLVQAVLPPASIWARVFGLKDFVGPINCSCPNALVLNTSHDWPIYVSPGILLLLHYTVTSLPKLHKYRPSDQRKEVAGQDEEQELELDQLEQGPQGQAGAAAQDREATQRMMPSPPGPDTETDNWIVHDLTSHSPVQHRPLHPRLAELREASPLHGLGHLVMAQSYVCALIAMMVWSITYHSWLTFVLLLWACLIWTVRSRHQLAMLCSPCILLYGLALCCLRYVWALDLRPELPTTLGPVSLRQLGLQHTRYPCLDLGAMLLYTLTFWLLVRQFVKEKLLKKAQLPAVLLQVAVADTEPTQTQTLLRSLGELVTGVYAKYWIYVCAGMFVVVSFAGRLVVYKIVYMFLFLLCLTLFQVYYSLWRRLLKVFWWLVVAYTMLVLIAVYTFQFQDFPAYWRNLTGFTDEQLGDLGLEQFSVSELFSSIFIPGFFLLACILQLHYFHRPFMQLTDLEHVPPVGPHRPRRAHRQDMASEAPLLQEEEEVPRDRGLNVDSPCQATQVPEGTASKWGLVAERLLDLAAGFSEVLSRVQVFVRRLLELHIFKLVALYTVWVALKEVSVMNLLLVVLWAFALPYPRFRPMASCLSTVWSCIIIVCKMLYQLKVVNPQEYSSNCSEPLPNSTNLQRTEINQSLLYRAPVDPANWFGVRKGFPNLGYIQSHLQILLLLVFEAMVYRRQEHYRRQHQLAPLPAQAVCADGTRQRLDQGLLSCLKYFVNFFFYKFGLEICFMMAVNVIGQRMNFMVILHGCWLVTILTRRRREAIARLWPSYCLFLALFLLYQYLLCLGMPPALCIDYPWRWSQAIPMNSALIKWLYLPDFFRAPNSTNLISDFLLLLCASQQWQVFAAERTEEWQRVAGTNTGGDPSLGEPVEALEDEVAGRGHVMQRVLGTVQFLWVLGQATVDGLTRWLCAFTRHHRTMSDVLRAERYLLTQELLRGGEVHRSVLDQLYVSAAETTLPGPPEARDGPSTVSSGLGAEEPLSSLTDDTSSPLSTGYSTRSGSEETATDSRDQASLQGSQELLANARTRTRTASELLLDRCLHIPELEQAESFAAEQGRTLRLLQAVCQCVAAHSELLCYFIIILNHMVTASAASLVLPVLIFLWAMLSIPRPSKRFWMTAIIFTEVTVVTKYLFQFGFFPWNSHMVLRRYENKPYFPPRILGLEKTDSYTKCDLLQLMVLFFHRSQLLCYGLWDHEEDQFSKEQSRSSGKDQGAEAGPEVLLGAQAEAGAEHQAELGVAGATTKDDIQVEARAVPEDGAPEPQVDFRPQDTRRISLRFRRRKERPGPAGAAATEAVDGEEEEEAAGKKGPSRSQERMKAAARWLQSFCLSLAQSIYQPLQRFFHDILHTKYRAATDVYVLMFLADVVDFIIIIFGFWAFGKHSAATDITSSLSDDQVPEAFLVMLLIHFSTMVVDRALYLRKTVLGKLAFQVVLVLAIHLWMFFILPAVTERMFSQNAVAQLWYFVKCIYFALSAYQIRCGYPTRILGNFLTKKYNHLNLFLFQGFRLVPFLVELRAVMDWVWTDTTLSLSNWMCVEDIYANIFIIKCSRETEKKYPQPKGQRKKKIVKYGMGGLIIVFLIAIIWFPLLFMSLVRSVVGVVNQPIDVTVTLKLGGYEPLFTMSAQQPSIVPFTPEAYEELSRQFDTHPLAMQFISQYSPEDIVTAHIEGSSGALWRISPPSRAQMKRELYNGTADITLRFTWNFQRDLAKGGKVEYTNEKHTLELAPDSSARRQLARLLEGTSDQSVVIPHLFPKYIRAPNGPEANPVKQLQPNEEADYLGVRIQLRREQVGTGAAGFLEWWVVELQDCHMDCNLLPMVIFSDKVSPPSLGFLAGYGIVGLYVSIVLVIGKFVRGFFSEASHSIMFEELPFVDRILKLCQDIFLVRETRELELEEELYAKLIFLYRSPETMIKWTREKE